MTEHTKQILLPCRLSDDEKRAKGFDLANAERELRKLKDDKATAAAEFSAKMKEVSAYMATTADEINAGTEQRLVDCEVKTEGTVVLTVRLDTGEVVAERAMTADERQVAMFPAEAGKANDA